MRLSWTFSTYIGRQFLLGLAIALAAIGGVAGLIDFADKVRRTTAREGIPMRVTLEMALMRLPHMIEQVLPYAALLGAMIALMRLTRSQELIVARASGVSVWQFLAPPVALGLLVGAVSVGLFNPLSAAMMARYEQLEARYITGQSSLTSLSASGLWLRQVDTGSAVIDQRVVHEYIMRAKRISQADMTLFDVTIYTYDEHAHFIGRIDATSAALSRGYWQMLDASISVPGKVPQRAQNYRLQTDLSIRHIEDSFAEPRTLSFWELGGFIDTLEKAGFPALKHKMHWHAILVTPLALAAMVLVAALFSLRPARRGRSALMIFGLVLTGFVINFFSSLLEAFGESGSIPAPLAAWAPPALVLMLATVLLLHVEDG